MKAAITIVLIFFSSNAALARPSQDTGHEVMPLEDEFSKASAPVPSHDLDDWKDWEAWHAPAKIDNLAPFYQAGHDFDGLPVIVVEFGNWNYREIAKLPQDELDAFNKHYEQYIHRVSNDGVQANDTEGTALILDFDGFELAHFASSKALKLILKGFTASIRAHRSLKYGISVNTNFAAETFFSLAKPFLGPILETFEFYGTRSEKWKPVLLRKIPLDQLPLKYGGKNDRSHVHLP